MKLLFEIFVGPPRQRKRGCVFMYTTQTNTRQESASWKTVTKKMMGLQHSFWQISIGVTPIISENNSLRCTKFQQIENSREKEVVVGWGIIF